LDRLPRFLSRRQCAKRSTVKVVRHQKAIGKGDALTRSRGHQGKMRLNKPGHRTAKRRRRHSLGRQPRSPFLPFAFVNEWDAKQVGGADYGRQLGQELGRADRESVRPDEKLGTHSGKLRTGDRVRQVTDVAAWPRARRWKSGKRSASQCNEKPAEHQIVSDRASSPITEAVAFSSSAKAAEIRL
jgi:hypothetical protein